MKAKAIAQTAPRIERGQAVEVHEPGIAPWPGVATAVKFSPVSGWWVDVRTEDRGTWVIKEADVEPVAQGGR